MQQQIQVHQFRQQLTSSRLLQHRASTLVILNHSSAWNSSAAASFPSPGPRTQSLLNDFASQSHQASTRQLMHHGVEVQPQHWASPLTTEVSHVPAATEGACQDHPFKFPWPLQQPFATYMFTQRLPPQISTTQQLSLSGIHLLQPSAKTCHSGIFQPFPFDEGETFQNATDVKEVSKRLPIVLIAW